MKNIISTEAVRLNFEASDWREAVKETGRLLVNAGIANSGYVDAMVAMIEEYGPYIIVAPGVAMPHARAESGAIKTGMSFLTLKNPVTLPQKKDSPVDIMIGVAAVNKEEHLEAFGQIAEKIMDDETLKKLKLCETAEEVIRFLAD